MQLIDCIGKDLMLSGGSEYFKPSNSAPTAPADPTSRFASSSKDTQSGNQPMLNGNAAMYYEYGKQLLLVMRKTIEHALAAYFLNSCNPIITVVGACHKDSVTFLEAESCESDLLNCACSLSSTNSGNGMYPKPK